MSDFDLLQAYARRRSEAAFRTLVGRYANLVFSAALRQTRDPQAAEDVAQAVFIILARKSGALPRTTILCGWLLRTVRFVALNTLRRETHRRQIEKEAMSLYTTEGDAAWDRMAPVLDEVLCGLSDKDRDAIALRFFEQRTFREIAEKVGTSEDNAQKRVSRALGKLRAGFARRGVVVPAALVGAAINTRAVHAAPGHLAASATSAVTSGAAAGGSVSTLAEVALGALERARYRALALRGAGVLLMLLVALLALHQLKLSNSPPSGGRLRLATGQPANQPVAAAPVAVAAFDESSATTAVPLGWQRLARDDFYRGAALLVLKPGLVVTGVVKDQHGQPIAGAQVTKRRALEAAYSEQKTIRPTGSDGRFRFGDVTPEDITLFAQADGFVGKRTLVHPAPDTADVVIELAPAGVLRGRVVDQDARPVVHAHVELVGGGFEPYEIGWVTTGDEGRFSWLSAPPSQERYRVSASGYAPLTDLVLTPDGTEQVIQLHRAARPRRFRISGSVTDRATRAPISAFEVWVAPTIRRVRSRLTTEEHVLGKTLWTTGSNGKFSFLETGAFSAPVVSYSVEIEAEGYRVAELTASGPFTNDDCELNFRLDAAPTVYATVQLPDGQPAVGATVLLCGKDEDLAYMRRPAQFELTLSKGPRTSTDSKGAFVLTVTKPVTTACIAHPSGYAQLPLEELAASRVVRLQAWGRIAGFLKVGSQVGANERIGLNNRPLSRLGPLQAMLAATTDAEGRFIFEGLPPGRWELSHYPKPTAPRPPGPVDVRQSHAGLTPLTQKTEVSVKPGATTQVALGGAGRKVVGQAKAGVPASQVYFQGELLDPTLSDFGPRSRPVGPLPSEAALPPEGQRDLRQYVLRFDSDGSFCIVDVLPGSYEWRLHAWERPPDGSAFALGEPFAPATLEVIVPEAAAGDSAPFDLGVLEVGRARP